MFNTATIEQTTYAQLAPTLIDQLWAIYGPHHHITREEFVERLQSFDQLALFWQRTPDEARRLLGLAGIRQRRFTCEGRQLNTFYLGQVFILPEARSRHMLIQRLVISLSFQAKRQAPLEQAMFWVDALSYKPYLVMTNNLAEYYPRHDKPTPKAVRSLVEQLGQHYYGELFDPITWTVRKPSKKLVEGVADITARDLENPHISFYASKNVGHAQGHGLIITCPMSLKNVAYCAVKRFAPKLLTALAL